MDILPGGPYPNMVNGKEQTTPPDHGEKDDWELCSSACRGAPRTSVMRAVSRDTGHPLWAVDRCWELTNNKYPERKKKWETQHLFYCALIVANRGTTIEEIPRVAYTPRLSGVTKHNYYDILLPMLEIIVSTLDEIKWENRLDPYNHTPEFPHYYTHIVDGFPIEVWAPSDYNTARHFWNGKYGCAVVKGEAKVSLNGRLVGFTFPFRGNTHDAPMHNQNRRLHPTLPNEYGIGDPAYVGNTGILTKFRQPRAGDVPLTAEERTFNRMFDAVRGRVEHIIGFIKFRPVFRQKWRGGLRHLFTFAHYHAQMCAMQLNQQGGAYTYMMIVTIFVQFDDFFRVLIGRYAGYGPWSHFPVAPAPQRPVLRLRGGGGDDDDSSDDPMQVHVIDLSEDDTCPICMDTIKADDAYTSCHHHYHAQCIGTWAQVQASTTNQMPTCPVCKSML
jgi:hypothetical protein